MRVCSRSSSIRISPTPRSSSVADTARRHPLGLDDAGHRDDFVAAYDERPAFTIGARDLCVDEHVLHLLPPACEPVARPPSSYLKAWQLRLDQPAAPGDAAAQRPRPVLEPETVVLAHGLQTAAQVDALRRGRLVEKLRERGRHRAPLFERAQHVLARRRMDLLEERHDALADQSADGARVRRVLAPREPALAAERLRLLVPDAEERAHDA